MDSSVGEIRNLVTWTCENLTLNSIKLAKFPRTWHFYIWTYTPPVINYISIPLTISEFVYVIMIIHKRLAVFAVKRHRS